jgi:hypothetical protein
MSRFFSKDYYPEYYKVVTIEYFNERTLSRYYGQAWLAWDEEHGYVWTINDTNKWISDREVLDWWE